MGNDLLSIIVPKISSPLRDQFLKGAALLSPDIEAGPDLATIYVEANPYDLDELSLFRLRMRSASQRYVYGVPTRAFVNLPTDEFVPVGTFDPVLSFVTSLRDTEAIEAWSGEPRHSICGSRLSSYSGLSSVMNVLCFQSSAINVEKTIFFSWAGQFIFVDPAGPSQGFSVIDVDDERLEDALIAESDILSMIHERLRVGA